MTKKYIDPPLPEKYHLSYDKLVHTISASKSVAPELGKEAIGCSAAASRSPQKVVYYATSESWHVSHEVDESGPMERQKVMYQALVGNDRPIKLVPGMRIFGSRLISHEGGKASPTERKQVVYPAVVEVASGKGLDEIDDVKLFLLVKNAGVPDSLRWAALERLSRRPPEGLFSFVIRTLEIGAADEFVYACTIALRVLPIPPSEVKRVANVMRGLVKRYLGHPGASPFFIGTFRQGLLVLGSFGDDSDIDLLLDIIESDKKAEHTFFEFESLRRLLLRKNTILSSSTEKRMRGGVPVVVEKRKA